MMNMIRWYERVQDGQLLKTMCGKQVEQENVSNGA